MTRSQRGSLVVLVVVGACGGESRTADVPQAPAAPSPVATSILALGGNGQTGTVGDTASDSLRVRVLDQGGSALAGALVRWRVGAGGARVQPESVLTSNGGVAATRLIFGSAAGPISVSATIAERLQFEFQATATLPVAASITVADGANQSVTVGQFAPRNLVVRVVDVRGRPLVGAWVRWSSSSVGLVASPDSSMTSSNGEATTRVQLGTIAGPQSVLARVASLSSNSISLTAIAGPAARLEVIEGQSQTAIARTRVGLSPKVRVTDQFGNRVSGQVVRFSVSPQNGSVMDQDAVSAADGSATPGEWVLSGEIGPDTLTAAINTASGVSATATIVASVSGFSSPPANFRDQLTAGYQGWFAVPGDGSPMNRWAGWGWCNNKTAPPVPGCVRIETYPDVRAYATTDLFDAPLGALGDGRPARLFASDREGVVDLHFKWMREYGIDGAALSRFATEFEYATNENLVWRNSVTARVRRAAEKYNRSFSIWYDVTGMIGSSVVQNLQKDWLTYMESYVQSQMYARQNGKPVVTLWGFGFAGRPYTPAQVIEIVRFFKGRGMYVVGGVPFWWRGESPVDWDQDPNPAWAQAYAEFDMLVPWSPGRIVDDGTIQARYATVVEPDAAFQAARGKDYGLTVLPGFAWSNWNSGAKNGTPRRGGQFLWNQIGRAARIPNTFMFIAMFDEYNEATAIAPTAENSSMIPSNQYFLTLDADGLNLSSDFYLRLTSAIRELRNGVRTWTSRVPTAHR